jgi:hypothetical protein
LAAVKIAFANPKLDFASSIHIWKVKTEIIESQWSFFYSRGVAIWNLTKPWSKHGLENMFEILKSLLGDRQCLIGLNFAPF